MTKTMNANNETTKGFKMRIELLAIVSIMGLLGGCAAEPVKPETSDSESELAVKTHDTSCAGAEKYDELAQLSCKLGLAVDDNGFTQTERAPAAASGETSAVRHYAGGCTGLGGCSRVVAEGWQAMSCGAFVYAYMNFSGAHGNLISSGTGACVF